MDNQLQELGLNDDAKVKMIYVERPKRKSR